MMSFFFLIVLLVILTRGILSNRADFILWLKVFCLYVLYMLITNSYVSDPTLDYFISIDQTAFYTSSLDLSKLPFRQIIDLTFENNSNQAPLAYVLFACIIKFAKFVGIHDYLLVLKLSVVFCGSLVTPVIAKTIRALGGRDDSRSLLWFAILSPVLCYSVQLLRDTHVCFLFTLMFYVAIKPSCRFRWLWLVLLILMSYSFRVENGLFALMFLVLALLRKIEFQGDFYVRVLFFIVAVVSLVVVYGYVRVTMMTTFGNYTARAIEIADVGSVGVRLNDLPFPFDVLSKTLFGQILPFPCWMPIATGQSYSYLRVVECFFPFFWTPVLCSSFSALFKNKEVVPFFIKACVVFCMAYIVLSSASTFETRRVMAAYPSLFGLFIYMSQRTELKHRYFVSLSIVGLAVLHIIYFVLKSNA